jgi:hypothetical protein
MPPSFRLALAIRLSRQSSLAIEHADRLWRWDKKSGWFSELYGPLVDLLIMFLWALLLSLGLCFSY